MRRVVIGRHKGCGGWVVMHVYGGRNEPEEHYVYCDRCRVDDLEPDEAEEHYSLAASEP